MARINEDKILLETFQQQRRRFEETSRRLIGQINNTDFVINTRTFLTYNQLQNLPHGEFHFREKLVYKEPLYQAALHSGEFQTYIQQNFLGYIDTVRAEPK